MGWRNFALIGCQCGSNKIKRNRSQLRCGRCGRFLRRLFSWERIR